MAQGRRYKAQKFEEEFYGGKGLKDNETVKTPKFEDAITELSNDRSKQDKQDKEENGEELIAKLLSNPETVALLKALAKQL